MPSSQYSDFSAAINLCPLSTIRRCQGRSHDLSRAALLVYLFLLKSPRNCREIIVMRTVLISRREIAGHNLYVNADVLFRLKLISAFENLQCRNICATYIIILTFRVILCFIDRGRGTFITYLFNYSEVLKSSHFYFNKPRP